MTKQAGVYSQVTRAHMTFHCCIIKHHKADEWLFQKIFTSLSSKRKIMKASLNCYYTYLYIDVTIIPAEARRYQELDKRHQLCLFQGMPRIEDALCTYRQSGFLQRWIFLFLVDLWVENINTKVWIYTSIFSVPGDDQYMLRWLNTIYRLMWRTRMVLTKFH